MQELKSIAISQIEVGPHRQRTEGEDEEIQEIAGISSSTLNIDSIDYPVGGGPRQL